MYVPASSKGATMTDKFSALQTSAPASSSPTNRWWSASGGSGVAPKKLNILLAEGASGGAAASLRALFAEKEDHIELTVVSAISTLLPNINSGRPELILLDLSLAQPHPVDTVRRVHRAAPKVPLVIIAEPSDKPYAAECLGQGAMDCILKGGMDAASLDRVLRSALEHNTLDGLANLLRDGTTGLFIREGFIALGARAVENARRNGSNLAILCAMVEDFDAFLAESGATAGDRAMGDVAAALTQSFRLSDMVARIGSGQFAALAVDAVPASVQVLQKRIEGRLAILNQQRAPGDDLKLRISTGFWRAEDHRDFQEFFDEVEAQLRRS
ncbi:MAG: hypothetical protein NVS9B4_28380 [Candidatus Acidiferrum sp.]